MDKKWWLIIVVVVLAVVGYYYQFYVAGVLLSPCIGCGWPVPSQTTPSWHVISRGYTEDCTHAAWQGAYEYCHCTCVEDMGGEAGPPHSCPVLAGPIYGTCVDGGDPCSCIAWLPY